MGSNGWIDCGNGWSGSNNGWSDWGNSWSDSSKGWSDWDNARNRTPSNSRGKGSGKSSGKGSGKDSGKGLGKSSGKGSGKDSGKGSSIRTSSRASWDIRGDTPKAATQKIGNYSLHTREMIKATKMETDKEFARIEERMAKTDSRVDEIAMQMAENTTAIANLQAGSKLSKPKENVLANGQEPDFGGVEAESK